jgi:hypothetical protein
MKNKIDQAVFDELLRGIVRKMQQGIEPPMANNSGVVLSKDIYLPGTITPDISKEEIFPLIDRAGMSQSDIAGLQFLKSIIDEKSLSPVMEGQPQAGKQTATEIEIQRKQSMMKLGQTILGVINLEKQINELLLAIVLERYTQPVGEELDEVRGEIKEVYRTLSVESTFENGQRGTRIIEFTEDEEKMGLTKKQVEAEENMIKIGTGENVRKTYMNAKEIRNVPALWKINIVPTEKDSSNLDKVLFTQQVAEGFQLFTPQGFNIPYLQEQWAIKNKLDPEKTLAPPAPPQQPGMEGLPPEAQAAMQQAGPSPAGAQAAAQLRAGARQPQRPSVNTLVGQ